MLTWTSFHNPSYSGPPRPMASLSTYPSPALPSPLGLVRGAGTAKEVEPMTVMWFGATEAVAEVVAGWGVELALDCSPVKISKHCNQEMSEFNQRESRLTEKGVRRQDARYTRGKPTVVIVRSVWDQVRNRAFLLTPTPLRRRLGLYWAIKWMICFREEKYYWWLDPPVLWFASLKLELRDTHWFRLKCRTRTMGFYRQRAPHCHSVHDAAAVKVLRTCS